MTEDRTQAEEVRRDRIIWTTLVILGVLVAAGALALGWRLIEGRLSAAKRLDRAVALLKESDATVTAVDTVVRAGVTPASAEDAAQVAPLVEVARAQLAQAHGLAGDGIDRLTDDEQEKALLVQGAARARLDMLEDVPAILSAKRQAGTAGALTEEAWTKTVAADKLALASVADYNKLRRANVKSAVASNKKAKAGFTEAAELFDRAALAFPEAPLGVFSVYVDGRIKLLGLSKKAGDSWLAGKIAEANKLRLEYNKTDELSVQRAKQLPGTPASAVAEAYRALTQGRMDAYYKAREKAAEADNALRTL